MIANMTRRQPTFHNSLNCSSFVTCIPFDKGYKGILPPYAADSSIPGIATAAKSEDALLAAEAYISK
jgi:hypothetical protein